MLPINVMYDSGIDELEAAAIRAALNELLELFPSLTIRDYGKEAWDEGRYSSADWYIRKTPRVRGNDGSLQLDADRLLDLITNEPWQSQEPHIDVALTSLDITAHDGDQQLNFVFGIANGRVTVQSVYRYRGLPDGDRYLAVKTVVLHELGHVLGAAADLNRSNTEYVLGPHCTNKGCAMRQGLSVPIWVAHARDIFQAQRLYCPQCLADIRRTLAL